MAITRFLLGFLLYDYLVFKERMCFERIALSKLNKQETVNYDVRKDIYSLERR